MSAEGCEGLGFEDIDHAVVAVADLNRSVSVWSSLGFTVAPLRRREDGPPRTTETRHILFDPPNGRAELANFVALQQITEPTAVPELLGRIFSFMGDSEGLKATMALVPDMAASVERMTAAGIPINDPHEHSEGWWHDDETGEDLHVRVRQLASLTRRMPFVVNGFQTSTIASWRHARWSTHPNTAHRLSAVTGVSEQAAADASFMAERVFGVMAREIAPGAWDVPTGEVPLRILTPEAFDEQFGVDRSREQLLPSYVAISFEVGSVDTTAAVLGANGVEHIRPDRTRVIVPRRSANNVVIEFVDAASKEAR